MNKNKMLAVILTAASLFSQSVCALDFDGAGGKEKNIIAGTNIGQASCGSGGCDNIPPVPGSVPAQIKAYYNGVMNKIFGSPDIAEWTVMIFVNGKNNLEGAGLYNINQMEAVGSTDKVKIVVELGRMNGQEEGDNHNDGDWSGSRRYLIKKDSDPQKITSPVISESIGRVDMEDYLHAVDFVSWARREFPAKRYMFVLWDHGLGWVDPKKKDQISSQAISFDDETGNFIKTSEIKTILEQTGKVDILAMDACLMQMAEIAYEVRRYAEFMVGSEEVVPAHGYDYEKFLSFLVSNPSADAESFAVKIVDLFTSFYAGMNRGAQLSAVRTASMQGLAQALRVWTGLARKVNDVSAAKAAISQAMRFDLFGKETDPDKTLSMYGDLGDFLKIYASKLKSDDPDAARLNRFQAE